MCEWLVDLNGLCLIVHDQNGTVVSVGVQRAAVCHSYLMNVHGYLELLFKIGPTLQQNDKQDGPSKHVGVETHKHAVNTTFFYSETKAIQSLYFTCRDQVLWCRVGLNWIKTSNT